MEPQEKFKKLIALDVIKHRRDSRSLLSFISPTPSYSDAEIDAFLGGYTSYVDVCAKMEAYLHIFPNDSEVRRLYEEERQSGSRYREAVVLSMKLIGYISPPETD